LKPITEIPWSDAAAARMKHPAGGACIDYLRREVADGVARLWHCKEGDHEAFMVTRLDQNPAELVVCYFEGTGMEKFGRIVVEASHARGIPVRAHTSQPLVARLLRRIGLHQSEIVLRSNPRKAA
jgi:hypothetical protein